MVEDDGSIRDEDPEASTSAAVEDNDDAVHDFQDGNGPVPAYRHPNGGGWVATTARVAPSAFVGEFASVFGRAQLFDQGAITDTAWLCGDAVVAGQARVSGDAVVEGYARILGFALVTDDAYVGGDAVLDEFDQIGQHGRIITTTRSAVGRVLTAGSVGTVASPLDEPVGPDDSAMGRFKFGWPGASFETNSVLRRLQGWELLLVLAIFPLGSVCEGLIDLAQRIQTHQTVTSHDLPLLNGPWLVVAFGIVVQFTLLAAAGMACYLLTRSGEGLRAINLGRSRWRLDLALLLPLFFIVFWIPMTFGGHLVGWLHLQGFYLNPTPVYLPHGALATVQVFEGFTAGIVEEIIVLGYLVRRLEQRGFSPLAVIAIDVAVRVSYHLYYGWNVIPIACWALVTVLAYRRVRRLLPFILLHSVWDAAFPFRAFYSDAYHVMTAIALVAGVFAFLKWRNWHLAPNPELIGPLI
jgi:Type II CAAX prenyl endopeptidase Rce1-like